MQKLASIIKNTTLLKKYKNEIQAQEILNSTRIAIIEILDDEISNGFDVISLKNGVIKIKCKSPVVAHEIYIKIPEIKSRILNMHFLNFDLDFIISL